MHKTRLTFISEDLGRALALGRDQVGPVRDQVGPELEDQLERLIPTLL